MSIAESQAVGVIAGERSLPPYQPLLPPVYQYSGADSPARRGEGAMHLVTGCPCHLHLCDSYSNHRTIAVSAPVAIFYYAPSSLYMDLPSPNRELRSLRTPANPNHEPRNLEIVFDTLEATSTRIPPRTSWIYAAPMNYVRPTFQTWPHHL